MFHKLICLSMLPGLLLTTAVMGSDNLLTNAGFESSNQIIPDGWEREQNRPNDRVFQTRNGVLRMTEAGESVNYYNAVSQTIPIDGGQSYYLQVEYRMDPMEYRGGVFVSYLDEDGKRLAPEEFLLHRNLAQGSWTTLSRVLTSPDPINTRAIKVVFVKYAKGDHPDNAIYFRNPVLEPYTGQDKREAGQSEQTRTPAASSASNEVPDLPQTIFPHNLTSTPAGRTYYLERGEVGFLRLDTANPAMRRNIQLEVEAPAGVTIEPYMHGSSGQVELVPAVSREGNRHVFEIDRAYNWTTWSNALLFAADDRVPDNFNLRVTITAPDRSQSRTYEVPVEQVQASRAGAVPDRFAYSAWQAFPVTRINLDKSEHELARRLDDNWRRSGWQQRHVLPATYMVPHRVRQWRGPDIDIRVGVSVSGAPTNLYCDSALADAGPDYFADLIRRQNAEERVKQNQYFEIDYEPYVEGPVTMSCFCETCVTSFREQNDLPDTVTGMDILRHHENEWVAFRVAQRVESVRAMVEGIKQINPDIAFHFCSMPLPPNPDEEAEYLKTYGIDLRQYDEFTDLHTPMNYTSTLSFFASLEREAHLLSRPRATIVSVGWYDTSNINPPRRAAHLFAAFFCDNAHPLIGQGLFVSQGHTVVAIKDMMADVAATEELWTQGTLDEGENKVPVSPRFRAEGQFYHLSRTSPDGERWVWVFNNHRSDDIYVQLPAMSGISEAADLLAEEVLEAYDGGWTLRIAPLEYRLIQLSPGSVHADWPSVSTAEAAQEERRRSRQWEESLYAQEENQMRVAMEEAGYRVTTPTQEILFDLDNSAEGLWQVEGKPAGKALGRGVFMEENRGAFRLTGRQADVVSSEILADRVEATFQYTVRESPYDGLVIQKTFTVMRDQPTVHVRYEVIPEGGFRMFRLRAVTLLTIGDDVDDHRTVPERMEYQVGDMIDTSSSHVSFVRDDAKWPNDEPFLSEYVDEHHELTGRRFIARDRVADASITLEADGVDQVFGWRYENTATLEHVYPDAYPTTDPHQISTWEASWTLTYAPTSEP
ncbi:hypothetical protein ACERK3_10705 [Phycisphaerales bacterium AB-hyl4]|uniref:Carbohydrate binding protein n=1 Tax=Natronomicrosphaera hydrolytica TaxID=3242702 RepID=A0ABV4U7N9_9BACT